MRISSEKMAGIVVTVSIHIAVAIPFLAFQLGYEIQREQSFVLDFTKQEEKQKQEEQQELVRSASEKLEEMIAVAGGMHVRNIAVDRGQLKDDRNTDAEQLYKDAERLAEELRSGRQSQPEKDDFASLTDPNTTHTDNTPPAPPQAYSGASVLYWQLDGRKATRLPVPAYRCYGAGEVTVIITVDNAGRVINAKVDDGSSSADGCLRNHAIRAARSSMFNASQTAPARQMGTITYAFIAQ